MITVIAFITMVIDHIGILFFPWEDIFRIIWRLAFPLFAWMIVRWFFYTKNVNNYMKRLFILAIISQISMFFFAPGIFNVVFTLIFWLLSIIIIKNDKIFIYLKPILVFTLILIAEYLKFDYWAYGVLTIILLYLFYNKKITIILFAILTFLFYWINFEYKIINYSLQYYSIFAIFLLYFTPLQKYDFKINKTFKYLFYPVHMTILYIIYLLLWF